jgi:hypothetical protein
MMWKINLRVSAPFSQSREAPYWIGTPKAEVENK